MHHLSTLLANSGRNVLPVFNGSKDPKGDNTTYRQWRFYVKCLIEDDDMTPSNIMKAIRKSLKGKAANHLVDMGERVTPEDVILKLDSIYGIVATSQLLLQDLFRAEQEDTEDVADWGCRLEELAKLVKAQKKMSDSAVNDILRSKFFTSLTNSSIQQALRHKYDAGMSFQQLMTEARAIEYELTLKKHQRNRPQTVQSHSVLPSSSADEKLNLKPEPFGTLMKTIQRP